MLVAAFALATFFGWWGVPVLAAAWGWVARSQRAAPREAALAAALGWAALLVWDALRGPLAALASRLGATMQVPPAALILVTLLLAAALAWSAATLAGQLAPAGRGGTPRPSGRGR